MAATGDSAYAAQAGTLWRINVSTGAVAPFSAYPNDWAGTEAMTARNGVLYVAQAGALWTVNTANGGVAQLPCRGTGQPRWPLACSPRGTGQTVMADRS